MDRAYSTMQLKAVSDSGGKRTFTGIASTISTDRMDDVVLPKGAKFKLPFPLLWQHNSKEPIGWVRAVRTNDKQIEVDCEVHNETEPGELKNELDKAWQKLKAKLVAGLSIGFNPIKTARIEGTYGYEIQEWDWLELSTVTIPANQDCSITSIKSADAAQRAASGQKQRDASWRDSPPGVSGTSKPPASGGFFHSRKENTMKTIQELRDERAQKAARQTELMELKKAEARRFTPEESKEFDDLTEDMADLDDEIRVKQFEATNAAAATPVRGKSSDEGSRSRGGMSFVKKTDPEDSFEGQSYIRGVIAKAVAFDEIRKGNFITPGQVAEQRWGKSHPNLVRYIKAAVAGGGTGSGEWGAELAQSDTRFTGDFLEYLYSKTVFDRLPLRAMPARVHVKGQDGAATGYWTGESKAIGVSKIDTSDVELTPLQVAALAVCSKQLLRASTPAAERLIRDSIVEASSQRVDTTFLSALAASAGVSPAGILNGLSALAPSGADAAAIRADFQSLAAPFLAAKNGSGLVHIMTPSLAMAMSMMVNALGQTEFPDIEEAGGTLFKRPVFTGDNVTPGDWIVLKPSDIWKIEDGGLEISMSDQATIEMNDAPAGASDTPTAMASHAVSMFQTESVAFKVVRPINYQIRRAGAVSLLSNAEYGGVVS